RRSEVSHPATTSWPAQAGHPVRRSGSEESQTSVITGLPAFAGNDGSVCGCLAMTALGSPRRGLSWNRHLCLIELSYRAQTPGHPMEITINDLGATARVVLVGRLDIAGADKVALPLATVSGSKDNILVDMSGVTFVASIGLRHLVLAAKAAARRGG